MGIATKASGDGQSVTVTIDGRFDFSLHKDFREAYKDQPHNIEFRVNLSGTDYLDSSALGMLLLLKKHAENGKVIIEKPNEEVERVLTIANFDKVFKFDK